VPNFAAKTNRRASLLRPIEADKRFETSSLRYLCVLCVSAVKIRRTFSTAETQSTQRKRREFLRSCATRRSGEHISS
jgi:hypothetical protein